MSACGVLAADMLTMPTLAVLAQKQTAQEIGCSSTGAVFLFEDFEIGDTPENLIPALHPSH